jgi:16S rRNA G527 N7-methylase RsmG
MTFEEFKNIITENFNHVDDDFFDNLIIYKKFLQEYNSRTNLTRLDTEDKI